jgi:hypothetical protein
VGGVALHGLDQVRDEVVAPLQLHVDLRPRALDLVPQLDQAVVHDDTDDPDQDHQDNQDDEDYDQQGPPGKGAR